jgi:tetratricopeptide (TPR) repeat protein
VETAPGLGLPFTQVGAIVGTLAYMAPEQLEGHEVDVRVDIFAVCVALFEALHGARPFTGDTAQELLASIKRGPPARPPRAGSQELHALIVRGLAADPNDRWPTIAALTDRLQAIARPSRRRAAALAVLAVAAGVGTLATLPGAPPPCSGVGDEIVETWGPTIAASVGEVFSPGDRGFVGATWRRALPQLDGYAERWSTTRLAVCEAREQGAVSERLHDLEVACLESRRQSLAATVAVIRRRGASMVDELEALVEVLPDLASCRDPARVQIRWAPPDDPEVAARAAALEGRLVDAEASMAGGELARADALVQEIAAALSGLPMPALVAELTRIEGQLASRMGRDDAHQDALQRHFAASLTIADHEAAGLAAAELMRGSVGSEATGVAETWQAVAEALLAGPGTRPLARATFQARLGEVAVGRGDLEAALRANEAGLAIAHEGSGLPWTLHALLLDHALGAEVMLGRHEKRERWTTELLGLLTEHRADGHPDQVRARTILAEGSIHSGDLARASAALDEAEAMLARGGITRTDLGFEVAAQRALLAGVRNDLAGLDAAAEKALALAGSPRDRLRVHGYVSSTYTNAGQYDRAIAAAKAGLAAVATDNTPELVLRRHETLLQLGLACLGGGRLDEADAAFVEAIERISTEPNTGALTLLEARIGLGSVLTQRGKWAEARSELEQILASIAGQKFPPGYLGNLYFSFARALWGPENRRPSAADATRAREQAALAIRDFTGVPSAESAIVEVESWLTTHPPAPPKR